LGFWSKKDFFLQFLVDILPLGFGSVDPHIFADLDPGSQNLADPKHWNQQLKIISFQNYKRIDI